jgi:hypothetical protein
VLRSQDVGSARLLLDVEIALNEVRQLESTAAGAGSCRQGIGAVEEYEDALVELAGQLKVFRDVKQLPEVSARMAQVDSLIAGKRSNIATYFASAKGRSC